ncbi:MAG: DedA family protein [Trebonia sp.]
MFDQFTGLVAHASGWAYAIVFLLAVIDALIPIVPSETVVITAGDNLAYAIGRRYGAWATQRFFRGDKARRRLGRLRRTARLLRRPRLRTASMDRPAARARYRLRRHPRHRRHPLPAATGEMATHEQPK